MDGTKLVAQWLDQQEDARDLITLSEMNGVSCAARQWRILLRYKPGPESINLHQRKAEDAGGRWLAHDRQAGVARPLRRDFGLFQERLEEALTRRSIGRRKSGDRQ